MKKCYLYNKVIKNPLHLFIKTENDIQVIMKDFYHDFDIIIQEIHNADPHEKKFLYILDSLFFIKSVTSNITGNYLLVGKDLAIQQKLQPIEQEILVHFLKNFVFKSNIFNKITDAYNYWQKHKDFLTEGEYRFIENNYKKLIQMGAHLSESEKEELTQLQKQALEASNQMQMNIGTCKNGFWASYEDLNGIPQSFLEGLKKNDDGQFWVGVDYPTHENVMKYCTVRETRKKLYTEFTNRGYPENVPLMKNFYDINQKLASLLGFTDAAHADITPQNTMAGSVEEVQKFLTAINETTYSQAENEVEKIKAFAQEEFSLTETRPWDLAHLSYEYTKKHSQYDEKTVAEYLPVTHCIHKILEIYSTFLNIQLTLSECGNESWAWDSSLKKITAYDANGNYMGEVILDLFPRTNKFTHACANQYISPCNNNILGNINGICFMVANCARPTESRDGLFTFNELSTFFHELGHTLHFLIGKTSFYSCGGLDTPTDFAELPSQMFEEWLNNNNILKSIGKHYITGELLPDDLIKKIIAQKHFMVGYLLQRQLHLSYISLYSFLQKDSSLDDITKQYLEKVVSFDKKHLNTNFVYSFMHLYGGYGARYYSYMWSLAYALDVFSYIKENNGLLDPAIGERYKNIVLAAGSTRDYKAILEEFIGRPLSLESLYAYMRGKL